MRLCSRVQYHLAVGQNPRKPGKIPSHLYIGNCDRDFLTHGGEYMIFKAIAPSVSETKHICRLMVPTGSAVGWKTLCFLSKMELQSQTVLVGKFFRPPSTTVRTFQEVKCCFKWHGWIQPVWTVKNLQSIEKHVFAGRTSIAEGQWFYELEGMSNNTTESQSIASFYSSLCIITWDKRD